MNIWEKPEIYLLGKAKDIIKGGGDSDPKTQTQPDDGIFEGFDAGSEVNAG